ncbi:MAG: hypothetical protein WKF75_20010 [Singulisphaera sp.]
MSSNGRGGPRVRIASACVRQLALTGDVVRQSLEFETDGSTRGRSIALLEELRAAEAAARARAARSSEERPRGGGR